MQSELCDEKRASFDIQTVDTYIHTNSRYPDQRFDQGICSFLVRHIVYSTYIYTIQSTEKSLFMRKIVSVASVNSEHQDQPVKSTCTVWSGHELSIVCKSIIKHGADFFKKTPNAQMKTARAHLLNWAWLSLFRIITVQLIRAPKCCRTVLLSPVQAHICFILLNTISISSKTRSHCPLNCIQNNLSICPYYLCNSGQKSMALIKIFRQMLTYTGQITWFRDLAAQRLACIIVKFFLSNTSWKKKSGLFVDHVTFAARILPFCCK